ncbi:TauD-domain-containing protein [Mollisia scopiformis]|uniref:TauD-domain-containing protein n=1 Tax=Mollisia scopiformis TaxID=149040 RepID=A0A194X1M3_MOLSC|nr:TauD-domain-containing protein [Mollisia scopiformis]KUJ14095.1 TauD-domain-containing protein [Mollisia scopiformis]
MTPSLAKDPVSDPEIRVKQAFNEKTHHGLIYQYNYAAYLPVYDNNTTFPPTEPFEFADKGTLAEATKPHLFNTSDPNVSITKLTPGVGTEIRELQLSKLSDAQKNELALLIAERGVVVFRGQDFKDVGAQKQKEFGEYFGKLHVHPVGAHVQDHIELHNIYLGPDNLYRDCHLSILPSFHNPKIRPKSTRLTTTGYHSDVSYEHQPPAITILTLLQPIQKLLEGLRAEHSGHPQAEGARRDGKFVRREPVISKHPIVRVHPVTGQKALFINPGFTRRIEWLKEEESDALLKLLFKHISHGQVRVKWEDGTVALWDNRVTAHTAISDYDVSNPEEGLRHGFRITTLGERPVGVNGLETVW